MGELHVYQNDYDTWVASSVEDATQQSEELYNSDGDNECYSVESFGVFRELPDDRELEILQEDEEEGWTKVERPLRTRTGEPARTVTLWAKKMTCGEWAKLGRGLYGGGEGP